MKRRYQDLVFKAADLAAENYKLRGENEVLKAINEKLIDEIIATKAPMPHKVESSTQKISKKKRRKYIRKKPMNASSDEVCIATPNGRPCKGKALVGFKYCWHHAAFDPRSGWVFCQYIDPTTQKACSISCQHPRDDGSYYCTYHANKVPLTAKDAGEDVMYIDQESTKINYSVGVDGEDVGGSNIVNIEDEGGEDEGGEDEGGKEEGGEVEGGEDVVLRGGEREAPS